MQCTAGLVIGGCLAGACTGDDCVATGSCPGVWVCSSPYPMGHEAIQAQITVYRDCQGPGYPAQTPHNASPVKAGSTRYSCQEGKSGGDSQGAHVNLLGPDMAHLGHSPSTALFWPSILSPHRTPSQMAVVLRPHRCCLKPPSHTPITDAHPTGG
jgi:hypothetical protein